MDPLDQRLQILGQAGLLSANHIGTVNLMRAFFLRRFGIELTEENAAAFFTHFCMALHRLEAGERIDPVHECVLDEIYDQHDYENAELLADELERIIALPSWERGYILMHLIVVLGNVRAAYDNEILNTQQTTEPPL